RDRALLDSTHACARADAIVCNGPAAWFAAPIARVGRRPLAVKHLFPDLPTRRFAHPLFPAWPLGAWYHRATFALGERNAPRFASTPLRLVTVSPHVLERPDDWPAEMHLTGYWHTAPRDGPPPENLARFFDPGAAPIYIGFGSMPGQTSLEPL